jgi:hypothetical protein
MVWRCRVHTSMKAENTAVKEVEIWCRRTPIMSHKKILSESQVNMIHERIYIFKQNKQMVKRGREKNKEPGLSIKERPGKWRESVAEH